MKSSTIKSINDKEFKFTGRSLYKSEAPVVAVIGLAGILALIYLFLSANMATLIIPLLICVGLIVWKLVHDNRASESLYRSYLSQFTDEELKGVLSGGNTSIPDRKTAKAISKYLERESENNDDSFSMVAQSVALACGPGAIAWLLSWYILLSLSVPPWHEGKTLTMHIAAATIGSAVAITVWLLTYKRARKRYAARKT